MPQCKQCQNQFTIYSEDKAFYKRISVPEPIHCPNCRRQQRLAWRCERSLHYRSCDLCGKKHLSSYHPDAPFPVYCVDCWYSDKWDQLKNGRDFDFNKPFFEQFADLQKVSPRASLFITRGTIENSDYINAATNIKNSYLIFAAFDSENCFYTNWLVKCFNVCDCTEIFHSEKCYDCVNCDECYNLIASQDCRTCRDSAFLIDCIGCHDCLGSANLRNQAYQLFNKQLTKEEYEKVIQKIDLKSYSIYKQTWDKFIKIKNSGIYKYYHGYNTENSIGDYLINCQNANYCFDCDDVENAKYTTRLFNSKDVYDVDHFGSRSLENAYYSVSCGVDSSDIKFSTQVWNGCSGIEYCDNCLNGCRECFGCISFSGKQNCILNKKYSKKDFIALKKKIIAYMKKTGEYGQFFPRQCSSVPYNESIAQDYYPLKKAEAEKQGYKWADEEEENKPATYDLPDRLDKVSENICRELLKCEKCGKNYKIIPQELEFNKEVKVPIPRECFDCRLINRLHRKNLRKLYKRTCINCEKEIQTTYSPDRLEKIYCEECYKKEIY